MIVDLDPLRDRTIHGLPRAYCQDTCSRPMGPGSNGTTYVRIIWDFEKWAFGSEPLNDPYTPPTGKGTGDLKNVSCSSLPTSGPGGLTRNSCVDSSQAQCTRNNSEPCKFFQHWENLNQNVDPNDPYFCNCTNITNGCPQNTWCVTAGDSPHYFTCGSCTGNGRSNGPYHEEIIGYPFGY